MVDKSRAISELTSWLHDHDVDVGSILVEHFESSEGCGVLAARNMKKGQKTLQIPLKQCISMFSARNSDLEHVLDGNWNDFASDEILALHLMIERSKGPSSLFAKYMQSLPTAFDIPLFWSNEELELLQGTNVLLLTQMLDKQVRLDYEAIQLPLLKKYEQLTGNCVRFASVEYYRWALSIIWTRAFGLYINGQYHRVLCPLLDMFNHSVLLRDPLDEFISYDAAKSVIQHTITEDCDAKTLLYLSYGPYSNAKLLYSYGFVDLKRDNPVNGIDIWVKIPPDDAYYQYKHDLLQANELTKEHTYDFAGTVHRDRIDERLLATMRIVLLTKEEIPQHKKAFQSNKVSVRNELAVYSALKTICERRLHKFPETLEQDLVLRDQIEECRELRKAYALQVRIEEKQVLKNVIALFARWSQNLSDEPNSYPPRM